MDSIEAYDYNKRQWIPYVPDYKKWEQHFADVAEGRVHSDYKGRYIVGRGPRFRSLSENIDFNMQTAVGQTGTNYPYKAYIDTFLSSSANDKVGVEIQLFIKDTAGSDDPNVVGGGYAPYVLNVDENVNFNTKRRRDCRLEVRFGTALSESITILMYGKFPRMLQIDKSRIGGLKTDENTVRKLGPPGTLEKRKISRGMKRILTLDDCSGDHKTEKGMTGK
ncbi:unnamed protein product [Mytilus coruscus]|uniref:Uncharacterized protein n=1 Tax=Mytilus coruscus TaxID=42192 RepID=A0A6J8CPS4_MYTCO|nr:unnamed protein product [Mytilus coruscus]